jgi:hypothetical protein
MIVGFLVLAVVAYKAFSHSPGRSGGATQDPEVDFYYAVRDKVSTMSQAPACQYGARAMLSFASPTNSWPLNVRKAQVDKVIDGLPDDCFSN